MDANLTPITPIPGGFQIPNINLEIFEKAVSRHEYEYATQLLLENLKRLKAGALFVGYPLADQVQRQCFTRFVAAILALFTDPAYKISKEGFNHIGAEHAIIDMALRYSHFESSDHVLSIIADNPEELDRSKLKISDHASLTKFLLIYSLRSNFGLAFEQTFRDNPEMMFNLWAGMLSPLCTTATMAHQRRDEMIGMHEYFKDVAITPVVMPTLSDAMMYMSYGSRRDKHSAKATVCHLFARWLRDPANNVPLPHPDILNTRRQRALSPKNADKKPTILVCVDWFTSLHAMYRCYAPIIRQLKQRFRVIGIGRPMDTDEVGRGEFEEWHYLPDHGMNLPAAVAAINSIKPDIIYYPSIGMSMWWVALSTVKLAPVQIMTLGHPASSMSPAIDYVLCDEGAIGDKSLFSEEIIEYPNGCARYLHRPDAPDLPALIEAASQEKTSEIRIAIPSMLCKVNAPFLQLLQQLTMKCPRKLVFHFWTNMIGLTLMQSAHEIHAWLPDAVVYQRSDYPFYMSTLSKCHFHMSTIPFGGTNSNIDAMLLGVPTLTLLGDQPHERFDALMLERAGLEDELVTHTLQEYADKAMRLATDDAYRLGLRKHLLGLDLNALFYDPPPAGQESCFVDAVWDAFQRGPRKQS